MTDLCNGVLAVAAVMRTQLTATSRERPAYLFTGVRVPAQKMIVCAQNHFLCCASFFVPPIACRAVDHFMCRCIRCIIFCAMQRKLNSMDQVFTKCMFINLGSNQCCSMCVCPFKQPYCTNASVNMMILRIVSETPFKQGSVPLN